MKYLIVDDSKTIRMTLKTALQAAKIDLGRIFEAGDADGALEVFGRVQPEVVLLDVHLGEPDWMNETAAVGIENAPGQPCLDLIKKMLDKRPDSKIVLVTSQPRDHPEVVEGIGLGVFGYVQKPIRIEAVKAVLAEIDRERGGTERIA